MRCFIGIPVPVEADAVRELKERIVDASPGWRDEKWVPAENLHVTLAFLGEVDEDRIDVIESAVDEALAASHPFSLVPARIVPKPSASRASMLWMAFDDPDGGCTVLASAMHDSLARAGFSVERRRFIPHLTLARARKRRHGRVLDCTVTERVRFGVSDPVITLYSSRLSPGGARYTRLRSWVSGGGPSTHG